MSRDSQYTHRLWHIEEAPAFLIACPKLELLADFDPPGSYVTPNVPGTRPGGAMRSGYIADPSVGDFTESLVKGWDEISKTSKARTDRTREKSLQEVLALYE